MKQTIVHVALVVRDYDEALDFYVGKLGMEVRSDMAMPGGSYRWLTIAPKGQDIEIILMKLDAVPSLGPGDAEAIRGLQKRGAISAGVLATDDCRRSYEELSAKGVEFMSPPKEEFYAIEALFKDPFGNWFSMTQRK